VCADTLKFIKTDGNYALLHILVTKASKPAFLRQILFECKYDTNHAAEASLKHPTAIFVDQLRAFLKSKRSLDFDLPLMIVLNPFGGTRKAQKLFKTIVEPLLQLVNIKYEKMETQYSKHAIEIAQKMDPKKYCALVSISGDGVFHELINGLLLRPDWKEARMLPISIIGSGSGNAMSKNLNAVNAGEAMISILNGHVQQLDIFSYYHNNSLWFSHLSLTWTFIADIDIERCVLDSADCEVIVIAGWARTVSLWPQSLECYA
jgi:hypothetical protein